MRQIEQASNYILTITDMVRNGLMSIDDGITAKKQIMEHIKEKQRLYVDCCHKWNERDKQPRYKVRRGEKVEYFMTHVVVDGKYKQITANSMELLYEKLFAFYGGSMHKAQKNITLEKVYAEYIESRERDAYEFQTISSQTMYADRCTWKKYFSNSRLSRMSVKEISQKMILDEYKKITGPGLIDRKAFNKVKGLLDSIFDFAVFSGYVDSSPSKGISKRMLKFKLPTDNGEKVYTKEERDKLMKYLNTVEPTVYSLAVQLALCFCVRIGELRALKWTDFDDQHRTMLIWHQIVDKATDTYKRSAVDVPHTKSHTADGRRLLLVSDEAVEVLQKLKLLNGDKEYILQSGGKKPISTNRFNEHLKNYCAEAGIRYFSSHKIRFFGATALFDAGVDVEQIRRIMGHGSIEMTQHYNRTTGQVTVDPDTWNSIFSRNV